ncbi:MAG: response regulator transcription factor [Anaerolineales bacterium]|nr:response regulator transcription factor [Anaerolineales bacterium]
MDNIRVLLVDDHILFREGLASLISSQPDMEIVGEAGDGLEAVVKALELKPDLILMDVQMPGLDGGEATRKITAQLPDTTVVMLTVQDDEEVFFQAIQQGAQGYLLKNIRSRDMIAMLRRTLEGEAAIDPAMSGELIEEFRRLQERVPLQRNHAEPPTRREKEILSCIARGDTNQEIADSLSISIHTVKSHVRNILSKLNAENRWEAAEIAERNKWLIE